jgi:hypothetical protein
MMKYFPWWAAIIAAVISYTGLKYGVAKVSQPGSLLAPLAAIIPTLAPLAAIGFLLLAAKQLYDGDDHDQGKDMGHHQDTDETDETDNHTSAFHQP